MLQTRVNLRSTDASSRLINDADAGHTEDDEEEDEDDNDVELIPPTEVIAGEFGNSAASILSRAVLLSVKWNGAGASSILGRGRFACLAQEGGVSVNGINAQRIRLKP